MSERTARLSFRCTPELQQRVDAVRGQVPRERWLREATERAVAHIERAARGQIIVGGAVHNGSPPHSPSVLVEGSFESRDQRYRQTAPGPNVENVVSSGQAKRDVTPIPKNGKR
jgi:hypothetical protein